MPDASLHLSGDPEADALLSKDPLALLIGMVLDQQVPLEKAFSSPPSSNGASAAASTPGRSRRWIPRRWPRSSAHARPCTAFRGRWRAGCRRCAAWWPTSTTATRPRCGPAPGTARPPGQDPDAPRLRRAQGEDLRRLPRQAARRPSRRLARGVGAVRRARLDAVDRRHRRRRHHRRACAEAKQQAKAAHKAEQARSAGAQGRVPVKKTRGPPRTEPGAAAP